MTTSTMALSHSKVIDLEERHVTVHRVARWFQDYMKYPIRENVLAEAIKEDQADVVVYLMKKPEVYWSFFPHINHPSRFERNDMDIHDYKEAALYACHCHSLDCLRYLVACMMTKTDNKNEDGAELFYHAFDNSKECVDTVKFLLSVPEFRLNQRHYNTATMNYPLNTEVMRLFLENSQMNPFDTADHRFERLFLDDNVALDMIELVYSDPRFRLHVMEDIWEKFKNRTISPRILNIISKELNKRKQARDVATATNVSPLKE